MAGTGSAAAGTRVAPTLELERELLAGAPIVIGLDEVGRGALAGPVAVGACAIGPAQLEAGHPEGLRDSKLLTPRMRARLAPASAEWAAASAVGWATPAEIDEHGIGACLGAAAVRALGDLWRAGIAVDAARIVLDGAHDWLAPALTTPLDVLVRPKADRDCAVVAAAAVIAKEERDARMLALAEAHPEWARYGWAANKGYGSAAHREALRAHGPTEHHRRTWLGRILSAGAPALAARA